jgi:hypothetical protein
MNLPHDLIPSLPLAGGSMSHSDLMGRPRLIPSGPRPPLSHSQQSSSSNQRNTSTSLDGHGQPTQSSIASSNSLSNRLRPPPRPGLGLRRVSSFSGSPANQAGVGATGNHLPAHSLPARSHGRRGSILGPERPPVIRRTSSYGSSGVDWNNGRSLHSGPSVADVRVGGLRRGHQRTASESTGSTIKRPTYTIPNDGNDSPVLPVKDSKSKSDGNIRLGRPDQVLEISRLITTLHSLTPPSRSRIQAIPNSSSLNPSLLLIPLAIVLESLVVERQILTSPDQPPDLPILKTGQSLQIDEGEGEIDWTVLRTYTRCIGSIIDQILPFIQNSQDRSAVEDMIRSVRMFVGKIKKVFAEVVQGYGDGYGFLKGWWDDGDMKGCAGEIGRWCDLFDV